MDAHIYKKIEIVGTSETSSDDAVQNAIARSSCSIKHLRWFEVVESRGSIKDGKIERWQVTIKIGFTMNE
jgi:flavin-binding protein dodecin